MQMLTFGNANYNKFMAWPGCQSLLDIATDYLEEGSIDVCAALEEAQRVWEARGCQSVKTSVQAYTRDLWPRLTKGATNLDWREHADALYNYVITECVRILQNEVSAAHPQKTSVDAEV